MPCDSIITNSVSITNLDRDVLKRALTARGIAYQESRNGVITTTLNGQSVTIRQDTIEARGSRYDRGEAAEQLNEIANEFKVMVAMQSVNESAEENGFEVEWNLNEFGQQEFTLERQAF